MSRHVFLSLFVFLLTAGVTTVWAQDYTTNDTKTRSVSKVNTSKCTQQDIAQIKTFDAKAKRYANKINKHVGQTASECGTKKLNASSGIKSYGRQMQSAFDFFQSEEYEQMKDVYGRCGKKIPAPKQLPGSYWYPDDNVFGDQTGIDDQCD